jgi:SRSO17 transposase
VAKRLCLPEAWLPNAYAARRTRCNVPQELTLQSKPQLAAAMGQALTQAGLLPLKYLVADCLYGNSPAFRQAVDACVGVTACVAMPAETRCGLQRPRTEEKTYTYTGNRRSKQGVVAATDAPGSVAALAAHLPASSWYQRTVSEGTQGPLTYAFARQRVTLCRDGLPARTVWLVSKRTVAVEPSSSYYVRNAPASTPLRTFVWLSGLRWAIEQCFEESKTELGMDHYAVRQSPGWHQPMLTTMLAHGFLWHRQIHWGKQSPRTHGVAAADIAGRGVTCADV